MARSWHSCGMTRIRVSTTVDGELLTSARAIGTTANDAALLDAALGALLERHRAVEVDASYSAYDRNPLAEPDAWGSLAEFREAAGSS